MQWLVPAMAVWCIADAYLGVNGVKVTLTSLLGLLLMAGWSIAHCVRTRSPEKALRIADTALFLAAAILVGQLCYAATRADMVLMQLAIQDLIIWAPLASGLSAFAYARCSWVPIAVTAGTYISLSVGALYLGSRQDSLLQLPLHGLFIQALGIFTMGIFFNRLRETVSMTIARLRLAEEQSHVDTLTGLFNRRKFDLDWERVCQESPGVCLVLVDIDHFKRINDSHGHPMGDKVLATVARCLASAVLGKGGAYRWGGEEFALIVTGGRLHGRLLAQRIMTDVASMKLVPGRALTVSAGLAVAGHGQSPAAVFQRADDALLEAKRAGRNRLICSPGQAPTSGPTSDFGPCQLNPVPMPDAGAAPRR